MFVILILCSTFNKYEISIIINRLTENLTYLIFYIWCLKPGSKLLKIALTLLECLFCDIINTKLSLYFFWKPWYNGFKQYGEIYEASFLQIQQTKSIFIRDQSIHLKNKIIEYSLIYLKMISHI